MKKIFKEPSIKVIKLDYLAILSDSNITTLDLGDDDYGDGYAK